MLLKYTPLLITAASIFFAIGLHWFYKRRFLLPSLLAAVSTGAVSYVLLSRLPQPQAIEMASPLQLIWNNFGFAFVSGLVLAMLIGYLMKYAPNFFSDN